MSFPVVAATNHSVGNGTSHTIDLPAGIEAGDLLIVFFANDSDTDLTWPEGWTEFFVNDWQYVLHLSVAYRKADGGEGATITVTSDRSRHSSHISYKITGMIDPDIQAPEASTGVTGTSTNPDPDELTPTGGAKDYLWVAVSANDREWLATAYPTNYVDGETYASGALGACTISVATRNLNAVSENPSTFTISNSDEWIACAVAVHPGAEAQVVGPFPTHFRV